MTDDEKIAEKEAAFQDFWDEIDGLHLPHLCFVARGTKISLQDNFATDLLARIPFVELWDDHGVLPHQIDACFQQNNAKGPAIKDLTAAWRQTKKTHGITGAAVSKRVVAAGQKDGKAVSVDVPFEGNFFCAADAAVHVAGVTKLDTCVAQVSYGGLLLVELNVTDWSDLLHEGCVQDEARALIGQRHQVDPKVLQELFFEGHFNRDLPELSRNLHRHVYNNVCPLTENGFRRKEVDLQPLIDCGDLVWATTRALPGKSGGTVLFRQHPTFTDQGASRWGPALWDLKAYLYTREGHTGGLPTWESEAFFAGLRVPMPEDLQWHKGAWRAAKEEDLGEGVR